MSRPILPRLGWLAIHLLTAVIGTAVLEAMIAPAFHPRSFSSILWKEWALSLSCAAFIGFFMQRTWKHGITKWVWVLPTLWLVFGTFLVSRELGLWNEMTGRNCRITQWGCRDFYLFTIPFVRAVAYSIGAQVSIMAERPTSPSCIDSLCGSTQGLGDLREEMHRDDKQ